MEKRNVRAIIEAIRNEISDEKLKELLSNYHENDIAEAFEQLDIACRRRLWQILDVETASEILSYVDEISLYLDEMTPQQSARILEHMDSNDAADALDEIADPARRELLLSLMEQDASEDVRLISSYDDEEIGSMMTTNYVAVNSHSTIKEAMHSMVQQAKENDNLNTIYVVDDDEQYRGAIDLRDLIIAREYVPLDEIISTNYPSVLDHDRISDTIEFLKDYAEDSIPVLNTAGTLLGIITSQEIVDAVDEEMGDDYAKLAGLTAEEDLNEKLVASIKKRMPWLILLLFLGMGVSSVVGMFEAIVAQIAVIMCFQSLILDMAGNVGTQSLAVTIRVLMDENVSGAEKARFVLKEMQIGGTNGLLLGSLAFLFVGGYLHFLKGYLWTPALSISGCVGFALCLAMLISSLVGTIIPIFFHKLHVDPAVASGPLITTVNDLVAVITYYSLAGLLLVGRI